jgi:hypothetical protein
MWVLLSFLGCLDEAATSSQDGDRRRPPHDTAEADPDDTGATDTGDELVEEALDPDLPAWTVLVFVNGDNDLERWALEDLNEMEVVGSTADVQVVVQLDRSDGYARADGDWSEARRYLIQADDDRGAITSPVLESLGEVDSGDADTVLDFVEWGAAAFPAQRYALILWDHGDGWRIAEGEPPDTKAISDDDDAGSRISVAAGDLTRVAEGAAAALGQPVDLFGFDACTMQQWEVAFSVGASARYLVASEDYEDAAGWPYDAWLADLVANPQMETATLGDTIALRFHELPDSTLSVLDLGRLPALTAAVSEAADTLVASGSAAQVLRAAAEGAQGYDGTYSRDHDLIDLFTRIEAVAADGESASAAARAREAAEAAVVSSYNLGGRVKNSGGLTIYSPAEGGAPAIYRRSSWSSATTWDEMLEAAAAAR